MLAESHDVDLAEFLPAEAHTPCIVAKTLAAMSEDDRLKFEGALAHPKVTTAKIVERFWARNYKVGKESVGNHRKGKCCCER